MKGYSTKQSDWETIYPIGSIYMSLNSTSPAVLFGGTWEQLKDKFLIGAGNSYSNGATGGNSTINLSHTHSTGDHALTTNQIPSHYHTDWHWASPTGQQFGVNSSDGGGTWRVSYSSSASEAYFYTGYTGGGAAHNHGNTGSSGSTSQSIMPPYLAAYIWKRIA